MGAESHLQVAERHVLRSAQLLGEQLERVRRYVRHGWDVGAAQALLYTMHKSYQMMLEHRDALRRERDETNLPDGPVCPASAERGPAPREPTRTGKRNLPRLVGISDVAEAVSPDPDEVYLHYLETCKRLGQDPIAPERARELIAGWTAVFDETMLHRPRRLH